MSSSLDSTRWSTTALVVLASCGLGSSCPGNPPPAPQFSIASVSLVGPAVLPDGGINGDYTATITITRAPGITGAITPGGPWWIGDEDSDFANNGRGNNLSFVPGVTFPAGATTATISWALGCRDGTVQGTALTLPGGTPNNPDSGEGTGNTFGPDSGPADIRVRFLGEWLGNTVAVMCN